MISIIVRAKNEEAWIGRCLKAVKSQIISEPYEIVLVDNFSTDDTVKIARTVETGLRVVNFPDPYKPGRAINEGIRASVGLKVVLLSAHCIPMGQAWLRNLVAGLDDPAIAGVYGKQAPLTDSSSITKVDLWQIFGNDRRIQVADGFFHNANSALMRQTWLDYPFDEDLQHVEDHIWGHKVTSAGYKILYEPSASVYHHHGINHHSDIDRMKRISEIIETYLCKI